MRHRHDRRLWILPIAAMALLMLGEHGSPKASLSFLNGGDVAFAPDESAKVEMDRRAGNTTMHAMLPTPDGALRPVPLYVERVETVAVDAGALYRAAPVEPATLAERVDARRDARRQDAVLSVSKLLRVLRGGKEGQVLTIRNGQPTWRDVTIAAARENAAGVTTGLGRKPFDVRIGGDYAEGREDRRYGGGGGSSTAASTSVGSHSHTDNAQGGQLNINAATTGSLGQDRGGTGFSSYSTGDLLIGANGNLVKLAVGSEGQALIVQSGSLRWSSGGASGITQGFADARYVNVSGDTMTGTLLIDLSSGSVGLEVVETASASTLFANARLASSGSLVVEGSVSLNAFTSCTALETDSNGNLVCGSDDGGSGGSVSTGSVIAIGDARYVKKAGDTMTGALVINVTGGTDRTLGLRVLNTVSGSYLFGMKGLATSGSLVVDGNGRVNGGLTAEGTISGSTLYAASALRSSGSLTWEGHASGASLWVSSFEGAGLTDCDASTQALKWDDTLNRFSCGAVSSGNWSNTGSLQTAFDARYVNTSGDTMTGALVINLSSGVVGLEVIQTISGSTVFANNLLASSGALVTESGANIDAGTLYVAAGSNRVGIAKTNPKSALDVLGTMSGSAVTVSSLRNCDTIDSDANGNLVCGSDQSAGSGLDQNTADARYVNTSGDTMTGALVIDLTSGVVGLEVAQIISGATIIANNQLISSGSLVTESGANIDAGTLYVAAVSNRVGIGTISPDSALEVLGTVSGSNVYTVGSASGTHLYAASTFGGAGLADCDTSGSSKLLWDASTKRFSCGTDQGAQFSNTGSLQTAFDARYVNTSGDTMTGALTINLSSGTVGLEVIQTISGSTIHANTLLRSSGSLITESGAYLDGTTLVVQAGSNRVGIGTASPDTALEVLGTVSGSNVYTIGSISGTHLYVASTFAGAGLTDCDASTSKLIWDASTKQFTCGTVSGGTSTGSLQTAFDARYVNTSGDTMTGALVINLSSGTVGLEVIQTISGSIVHAQTQLRSSGSLAVEGGASLQGQVLVGDGTASAPAFAFIGDPNTGMYLQGADSLRFAAGGAEKLGISSTQVAILASQLDMNGATIRNLSLGSASSPGLTFDTDSNTGLFSFGADTVGIAAGGSARLRVDALGIEVFGTASGNSLFAQDSLISSGSLVVRNGVTFKSLTSCSLLATDSAGALSCGSGLSQTSADARYVNTSGDTMTGALVINLSSGTVGLEVVQTISGSTIFANNLLASSGSLVTESGANLDAGTFYVAAGSNRVGINTLTPKAAFDVAGTMSGSQLIVSRGAFFSGSGITFSTTGSVVFNENSRPVDFRIEGDGNASLFFLDASADRIGIATSAPKATLDVLGTASGTDIYAARSMSGKHLFAMTTFGGAGLTDCDTAGSSKLLWDASTKQFSCGTDQGSLAGADARYVNTSGDTMTGALTISKNSGSTLTISGGVLSHTAYGQPRTLSGVNLARNIISLAVDGRYMVAGMAGGANDDLYYIDVANGSRPSIEGAFNTEFHDVADIAVSGRYAYLALTTTFSSGAELQIIDLSNPSAIRAVGSLDIGDRDAKAVYVSGKFAIVGLTEVGSEDDFLVIDISNPASPRLVGGIDLGASVNDLFVEGRYAYVAAAGAQPFVVDLSNPADPRQVNQGVFVAESYTSVYVSGRYAYTGDNTPLFNIWDVSNPASPSSVGTLALAAEPNAVVVAGKYAYVATDSASGDDVKIIDVSNPALPLAVGGINLGTDVNALGIAGKYLHVGLAATSGTEVRNLDLAGIDAPSAAIGALSTSFLMVYENAMVNNNLYVGNALNVGLGGIESHGPLSVTVTASGSYSGALTGAIIRNRTMTGPVLALDGFRQGSGAHVSPHILFGYQGTFDTVLYRGSASTLRTDDQLLITARDNENRTLIRLDTEETTETINVFEIISDVTANDDRVFRITASGAVYSDAPYNSAGADYAEWFYAGDARLEPGEAVCVDVTRENAVKRCDRDGDVNVMGIVSTRPAFIGNVIGGADGLPVPGYALVGLIGQVPAKVLVESASGAIRPGDSLTAASRPGYARKAKAGESTVGVALQGLASGEGRVNVLISRRNQSLTVEAVEQEVLGTIADMQIDDEVRLMVSQAVEGLDLGDEVAGYVAAQIEEMDLDARIARIVEERLGQMEDPEDSEDPEEDEGPLSPEPLGSMLVGSIAASGSVHVSDTLKARYGEFDETLTVSSDARIGGDLYLEGALIAADLFVPGALSVDGSLDASRIDVASGAVIGGLLSVRGDLEIAGRLRFASGSVLSIDDIVVRDALFVMGDLTIEGLATFLGDVTVKGELGVSSRQAGFAVIPASGTSVTIPFDPPFSGMPVVTATPNGYASMPWWVATPTATGFTIMLKEPAASPITFSWLALATDAAVLTEGATGSLVPAPEEQGIDEASEQPAGTVTSSSAAASSASSDASMSSASSDVSNEGESSMASPSSEPAAESTEPPATSSASPDSPLPGVAPAGAESGASPIWSEFESAEPIEQAVPPVDGTAEEPVPEPPPASGEPAA